MPLDRQRRDRIVRIKAMAKELFDAEAVCDCEALASLVDWVLEEFRDVYIGFFNNDEEAFVEDLGYVLTELDGWGRKRNKESDIDLYLGYGYAGDSCFKPYLRDGSNQVRHLWGFIMLGFQYTVIPVAGIALLVEESWADFWVSHHGAIIGSALDGDIDDFIPFVPGGGGLGLEDISTFIRVLLCD